MSVDLQAKNAYKLKWARANPEKVIAAQKKHYEANREKVLACKRKWDKANKEKRSDSAKIRYQDNKERMLAVCAKYRKDSPDKRAATTAKWREDNKENIAAYNKRRYEANRGKFYAACRKRQAAKLNRTPSWADMNAINFFYECCPKGCHVDHIVPLQGKYISGLHVAENLQWLPASENCSKGNGWFE